MLLSVHTLAHSLLPMPYVPTRAFTANLRPAATITMKKGRAQGGGPKIPMQKKKNPKTDAERAADKKAAEIVRRTAVLSKRKPTVVTSRQAERFSNFVGNGASQYPVFARPAGDRDWVKVGHMALGPTAKMSAAEAAWLQKRCILEHAGKLHPKLLQQKDILQCGLGPVVVRTEGAEEEGAEEGVDANENVELLSADEGGMTTLPRQIAMEQASTCGFLGLPVNSGHYYGDSSVAAQQKDSSKVTLTKLGNDAKSAVQLQQAKVLGLHSLA